MFAIIIRVKLAMYDMVKLFTKLKEYFHQKTKTMTIAKTV